MNTSTSTAVRPPAVTYVVHGEPDAFQALRDRIRVDLGWPAVAPRPGERVLVWPGPGFR
ncbi:MBL fold metallo-hydrolase RNA specificity domain-containing protein [Nonomuraea glycinis]|uniref:MBL fold metallo-hydrolase RNA specificity domain-containing protein n=1 Tax=Nonomuraea glycinis TaxID=2047744 RepID=UPI002E0D5B0B|nr:hypothetical protein OHA68_28660 [Nonomuraea glycinis]